MPKHAVCFLLGTLAACHDPSVSPWAGAPTASGIIEGSVMYRGPAPACQNGDPLGRMVLTLFDYDNPPPPSGTATSAVSLLAIPARDLFIAPHDCDAEGEILRVSQFFWPNVPRPGSYMIRAFYDNGGDFVPFFSARRSPSQGDLLGGAFVDPNTTRPVFEKLSFTDAVERPAGELVAGVLVTVAAPVNTEIPVFRLGVSTQPLDSSRTLPLLPDPLAFENELWSYAQASVELIPSDNQDYASSLAAAGVESRLNAADYAWYVRPVDLDEDGATDPHPLLGSAGVGWYAPLVFLRRARTVTEELSGVPSVTLVGSVRPSQILRKRVFAPELEVLVPPLAVVDLLPGDPQCRIPYIPPGNLVTAYETGATECQELPSGVYDVTVIQGLAAAQSVEGIAPEVSDTGFDLNGGSFAGQSWSIPNELGPPDLRHDFSPTSHLHEELLLDEQGPAGRFTVFDADGDNGVRHDCEEALDPDLGAPRAINANPVPSQCCRAIRHLCDVPLCDVAEIDGAQIREAGGSELSCVPFLMPASCCP